MENEHFVDRGAYPHSRTANSFSLIILGSFLLALVMLLSDATPERLLLFTGTILILYLVIVYFRIASFKPMRQVLLSRGVYLTPPPRARSRLFLLLGVVSFLFGPLIAAGFLDPFLWLLPLGGVICGLNLSELTLSLYVARWKTRNGLKLRSYELWQTDESGRSRLAERGVRADGIKSSEAARRTS